MVITQGDDGDVLYLVDEGKLECTKILKKGEEPTHLKFYGPGEAFGELALLYNAPRAASIRAETTSILFALNRETFNYVVKDAAQKKRNRYESFLSKIELLDTMDPYERMKIADVITATTYKKGEYVIR
jgi:cAMP-dependent protein kinase regulator